MPRGKSARKDTSRPKRTPTIEIEPEREEAVGTVRKSRLKTKLSINSENFVMRRVGNFDDHYIVTGKIGEGSFGSVYRVCHRSLRIQRALKTIKKRGPEHFSSFEEIEVLKRLDHSNILKIYEFYEAPDSYYIITEIFEGKQLYDVLIDQEKLTERDAADILREVLRAVNYTHSQEIAHRDIKPENILVRRVGERYKVKIIDWGLGTLMGKGRANRICGTPEYVAPEVLQGSYSLSCDMWSIGAIAYVMLTGEMPFSGEDQDKTIDAVKRGIVKTNIATFKALSAEARKFITGLLNKNAERRMTASQALQHEWLRANASKEGEPLLLKETLQRLKEIKLSNGLSTAVISYVNNHLCEEAERDKLEDIFKHLDANNDGVLSLEELIEGYTTIYGREVGRQIALETFNKLDINHNNSLEFSEFVTFGLKQQRQQEEGKLREAFQLFDRDRNGRISKEEISLVLRGKIDASLQSEISEIIKDIDQNGDEEIDVEEFIKSIEKIPNCEAKKDEPIKSTPQRSDLKNEMKEVKQPFLSAKKQWGRKVESVRILRSNSKNL